MSDKKQLEHEVGRLLTRQDNFFKSQATRSFPFRMKQLERLKMSIMHHEQSVIDALKQDLGKHETESMLMEIGIIYQTIGKMVKNLKKWSQPKRVKTPIFMWPGKSHILNDPYGKVLIIGPFNYPFQLIMDPLVGAISAGNTAVVKPSELTPNVSKVIETIITEAFDEEYVSVKLGDVETNEALIAGDFDYIFFTGSTNVGKIIAESASKRLIPHTLELGGKSPAIVDTTVNIRNVARKIVWGKLINAGQTCIAPDYLLVHEDIKDELVSEMKHAINVYYGINISENDQYGKIVNKRHHNRLSQLIDEHQDHIIAGGAYDEDSRFIEPTLVYLKDDEYKTSSLMTEEIFGPILPIITYQTLDEAIDITQDNPNPLALYIFSNDDINKDILLTHIPSGDVSINNVLLHVANSNLPFGGLRNSGVGNYKGKFSIETFTHQRGLYESPNWFDMSIHRAPYTASFTNMIKKVLT